MLPANVDVRLAVLADAPTIARFQIEMAMETENKKLDANVVLPAVEAVFRDANKGYYLVAEIADDPGKRPVVASLLITYEWSDWRNSVIWYIQSVYVDPDWRGRQIFGKLFADVIHRAERAQAKFVRLYVEAENHRAVAVYESLGMKRLPYYMYQYQVIE
jgi:ribosomal protein S18 acetylase RimI-like enzyme